MALLAITAMAAAHGAEPGMFLCRSLLVANDFWTDLNQIAGAGVKLDMDIARGIARRNGCPLVSSSNLKPIDFAAGHAHPARKIRHPRDVRRVAGFSSAGEQCRLATKASFSPQASNGNRCRWRTKKNARYCAGGSGGLPPARFSPSHCFHAPVW